MAGEFLLATTGSTFHLIDPSGPTDTALSWLPAGGAVQAGQQASFSPDNIHFAFSNMLTTTDIIIGNILTNTYASISVPNLKTNGYSTGAVYWSPDGTKIMFPWNDGTGGLNTTVGVMNADGTGQAALIAESATIEYDGYGWLPDNVTAVVTETTQSGAFPIALTTNDGSTRTVIYTDPTETYLGSWPACVAGDGSAYIFGDDTPPTAIGIITIPGGAQSILIDPVGHYSFWAMYCTPNNLLLFTDNGTPGNHDIRSCHLDGSGETVVFPGPPSWESVTATPNWGAPAAIPTVVGAGASASGIVRLGS